MDMIKPTLQQGSTDCSSGGEAFSLKVVCEQKAIKKQAKQLKLDKIFAQWGEGKDESKLEITRLMFQKFPPEIYSLVSKSHCIITARRKRVLIAKKAPTPEMIAETLCMNELRDNLPEPSKSRKKNPRIMVNGEKVVDSDIEDKKEA